MAKSTSDTCCLTLPLLTEKWQEDRLEKRLELARQIYNTLLRYEWKKWRKLQKIPEYRQIEARSKELYETKDSPAEQKALTQERQRLLKASNLTEYGFKDDIKLFYKHFRDNIGSAVAVHGIAAQAWTAFHKMLWGSGRQVHFKRKGDFCSVQGSPITSKDKDGNPISGGNEIRYRNGIIEWKGLSLRVKLDPRNAYETEMLSHRIKYCRIIRKTGKNKNRYYVQLILQCKPVIKTDPHTGELRHPVGHGVVGLDLGPQTLAYVSDKESNLVLLADRVEDIEHQKWLLQRKLDRSRRATNPENYHADGTIVRGKKLTHHKSKRYLKLQRELAYLHAKQADIRKRQHMEVANHLLSLGDCFIVEDNRVSAWARRAKETKISEKTGRYQKKKRFGKSIANRAPAMLLTILDTKLTSLGLSKLERVPTSIRASQYNHLSDAYEAKALGQRWNHMPDGRLIQRDLYSAFLLQHVDLTKIDRKDTLPYHRDSLHRYYPLFCVQHHLVIKTLSQTHHTVSSMGL